MSFFARSVRSPVKILALDFAVAMGETSAAFFSGTDILQGDWFGIGRRLGGTWGDGNTSTWKDLAALHIGRKIQPDQFVEMAFAAIGDTLTLYVDGTKVITVEITNSRSRVDSSSSPRNMEGVYLRTSNAKFSTPSPSAIQNDDIAVFQGGSAVTRAAPR